MSDFEKISTDARDRLVAELHRSVQNVSAAIDEAAGTVLDAAESRRQAEIAAARIEYLANEGLEPLRKMNFELVERAADLDREIARLSTLATEAAEALRAPAVQEPRAPELRSVGPEPELVEQPEPFELPPIFPSLAPDSPLDRLEEHRRAIAEAPLDFPPRRNRFPEPEDRPVEIRPGLRVIVEQLRIAGEPDSVIADQLEKMGVEDPAAVLAQVERSERSA